MTVYEAEINSEYHAPRKYRFMVFFVLAQDHNHLFQTFLGVWMLISLLFINPILNMLHIIKNRTQLPLVLGFTLAHSYVNIRKGTCPNSVGI